MSHTFSETYILYKLEQVQKELGIFDLLDWSKLVAGYDLNLKMVTYKGFTGMEIEEKNRIVAELKERLATMPEIKPSKPLDMQAYAYKRKFPRSVTLYNFDEVVDKLHIHDNSLMRRILKDYEPTIKLTEYKGRKGIDETEKNRIVAELKERHKILDKQDRLRELEARQLMYGVAIA